MKKTGEGGRPRKTALFAAALAAVAVLVLVLLLLVPEREAAASPAEISPDKSGRFEDAKAKAAEGMRIAQKFMYEARTGCGTESDFTAAGRLLDDAILVLRELVREFPNSNAVAELLREAVATRNNLASFHSAIVMR
jgi:hypothetical protein